MDRSLKCSAAVRPQATLAASWVENIASRNAPSTNRRTRVAISHLVWRDSFVIVATRLGERHFGSASTFFRETVTRSN